MDTTPRLLVRRRGTSVPDLALLPTRAMATMVVRQWRLAICCDPSVVDLGARLEGTRRGGIEMATRRGMVATPLVVIIIIVMGIFGITVTLDNC